MTNQAALYREAPTEKVGTASGLLRTFGYVGSIASATITGIVFRGGVDDAGLRHVLPLGRDDLLGYLGHRDVLRRGHGPHLLPGIVRGAAARVHQHGYSLTTARAFAPLMAAIEIEWSNVTKHPPWWTASATR